MIYDYLCYRCPDRKNCIDEEIDHAKDFNKEYGCDWIFPCGARYNPKYLNLFNVEIVPCYECIRLAKKLKAFNANVSLSVSLLAK